MDLKKSFPLSVFTRWNSVALSGEVRFNNFTNVNNVQFVINYGYNQMEYKGL